MPSQAIVLAIRFFALPKLKICLSWQHQAIHIFLHLAWLLPWHTCPEKQPDDFYFATKYIRSNVINTFCKSRLRGPSCMSPCRNSNIINLRYLAHCFLNKMHLLQPINSFRQLEVPGSVNKIFPECLQIMNRFEAGYRP